MRSSSRVIFWVFPSSRLVIASSAGVWFLRAFRHDDGDDLTDLRKLHRDDRLFGRSGQLYRWNAGLAFSCIQFCHNIFRGDLYDFAVM